MKRVMEAEFFPRNSDHELSPPVLIGDSAVREKRRILIIDNDRESTRLVKILLERAGGYLVLEENDATKAHQSARNFRPDLILLDIVMPVTDGGENSGANSGRPRIAENTDHFSYCAGHKS